MSDFALLLILLYLAEAGVRVTVYAVTWVTVEPVGYTSFLRVYVTMRNREPGFVTD